MSEENVLESEIRPAPKEAPYLEEYALLEEIMSNQADIVISEGCYVHKQPRRIFVQIQAERIRDFVQYMMDKYGLWQFSTLSGRDLGDELQANYHFFLTDRKIAITIKLNVPRNNPEYPSICEIVPAVEFIENELREMYGIRPMGHPNVRRVELPENWPEGEYPLRKDWEDPRGLLQRSKTLGPKPKEEL